MSDPIDRINAEEELLPLVRAALRLGLRYPNARDLLFTGRLKGKQVHGRWYVTVASVERYAKNPQPVRSRTQSPSRSSSDESWLETIREGIEE